MDKGYAEKVVDSLTAEGFLNAGRLSDALEIHKRLGISISGTRLIECGNICLREGRLEEGRAAYEEARQKIPKEMIIECGNAYIKKGRIADARELFKSTITISDE